MGLELAGLILWVLGILSCLYSLSVWRAARRKLWEKDNEETIIKNLAKPRRGGLRVR